MASQKTASDEQIATLRAANAQASDSARKGGSEVAAQLAKLQPVWGVCFLCVLASLARSLLL